MIRNKKEAIQVGCCLEFRTRDLFWARLTRGMIQNCVGVNITDRSGCLLLRAFAVVTGCCRFDPRPSHTEDFIKWY